jgi:predicted nucleic acid-binding protein
VILVDSSAWIEYLRATGSTAHLRVRRAIADDEPLATTGIVLLEVLSGARDAEEAVELVELLAGCRSLPLEEPSDHEAAAELYRRCRRAGTSIRRLPDCLIAVVAMRTDSELLHRDADFDRIAAHAPLAVVRT